MSLLEIDIRIEDERWSGLIPDLEDLAHRALSAPAGELRSGALDLLFTNDDEMHVLNRTWRKKDSPTDVLSFPGDDPHFLGDIAIGLEVSTRDADALGRNIRDHIAHLLVHGYLHLLGYDHMDDEEAREMEALETKFLARIGVSNPYS